MLLPSDTKDPNFGLEFPIGHGNPAETSRSPEKHHGRIFLNQLHIKHLFNETLSASQKFSTAATESGEYSRIFVRNLVTICWAKSPAFTLRSRSERRQQSLAISYRLNIFTLSHNRLVPRMGVDFRDLLFLETEIHSDQCLNGLCQKRPYPFGHQIIGLLGVNCSLSESNVVEVAIALICPEANF